MTLARLAAAALAALALGLGFAGPAAAKTTNIKIPMDGIESANVCTGETITLQGTQHVVAQGEFSEEGRQHVRMHVNLQGVRGIGSFGNEYRYVQTANTIQNAQPGGANVITLETIINAVSKGRDVNFQIHQVLHFTFNANGEPTAEVMNFHVHCQGPIV